MLIEFSLPDDLRGASVLLLERKQPGERDMFMYLPELRSVKRITSRMVTGSMFGTDFSYEDFEMIEDYAAKAQSTRAADALIDGQPAWVLESRPAAGEIGGYTRILEYIDPETCVRLKTELFEANDRLRKVASSDRKTLSQVSGLHYAPRLTLRDLVKQTETELAIEKIEVGVDIPEQSLQPGEPDEGQVAGSEPLESRRPGSERAQGVRTVRDTPRGGGGADRDGADRARDHAHRGRPHARSRACCSILPSRACSRPRTRTAPSTTRRARSSAMTTRCCWRCIGPAASSSPRSWARCCASRRASVRSRACSGS